jgi:hypothetical protein
VHQVRQVKGGKLVKLVSVVQ